MDSKRSTFTSLLLCLVCLGFCIVQSTNAQANMDVRAISWSPDSLYLAAVGNIDGEGRVVIVDEQYQLFRQFDTNTYNVLSVNWSPDATSIAAAVTSESGVAYQIWNVLNGTMIYSVEQFGETSDYSVQWHPFRNEIMTLSSYRVNIRDAATGDVLKTIYKMDSNTDAIEMARWSIEGERVFTISGQNTLRSWDVATSTLLWEVNVQGIINVLATSYDGTRLAVAGEQDTITIIDVETGRIIDAVETNSEFPVNFLQWYPNNDQIVSVSNQGNVNLVDLSDRSVVVSRFVGETNAIIESAELSSYGGTLSYALRPLVPQAAPSLSNEAGITNIFNNVVLIIVPDPSPERLQAIAEACDAPPQVVQAITQTNADVPDTLSAVVESVEALPTETIPPGCAADLIAVAEAIQAQGE